MIPSHHSLLCSHGFCLQRRRLCQGTSPLPSACHTLIFLPRSHPFLLLLSRPPVFLICTSYLHLLNLEALCQATWCCGLVKLWIGCPRLATCLSLFQWCRTGSLSPERFMGTAGLISKVLRGLLAFLCHQCSALLPSAFSGQSVCSLVQASLPRDQPHLSPHYPFPMAERPREDASHCLSTQGQRPGLRNPARACSVVPGEGPLEPGREDLPRNTHTLHLREEDLLHCESEGSEC